MKKKILYLTDNNIASIGGVEESLKILINGLCAEYEIGLVQPGLTSECLDNTACTVYGIGKLKSLKLVFRSPFLFVGYMFAVSKLLREIAPEYVHTHSQASFFIVSLLIKLGVVKKRFIFLHTERGIYTKYGVLIRWLFGLFVKQVDSVVFTTEANKKLWLSSMQRSFVNLLPVVIPNAAGEVFQNTAASDKVFEGDLTIGFAGRYCDWKDWPLAYDIVNKLKQQGVVFKVKVAVGCNDEAAHSSANEMFSRFNTLMGGRFSGEINLALRDMVAFYDSVDVFILTSWPGTESFGRTIVEAMSRGCVVLSTASAGPIEIISSEDLICSAAEEFVSVIYSFDTSRDMIKDISEQNLQLVKSRYLFESNIGRHLQLYNKVC